MVSRLQRGTVTALVLLLALAFLSLPRSLTAAPTGTMNQADIVVQLNEGEVVVRRIVFTETSISGLEALTRAGFDVESSSGAVCRIEETGCPATNCFCAYPPTFWSYYHRVGGAWQFSEEGAADYQVTDGAVEAWRWTGNLPPADDTILAAHAALTWMAPQQEEDGSYANSVGATVDVALAVAAANVAPASWESESGNSLWEFLTANGLSYATSSSRAGKLALGVAAAGGDPRTFVGSDLILTLTESYNPETGSFGPTNWDQAYAMLGWRAAGEPIPLTATQQLQSRVNADGGWGFAPGSDSDVDSTALAVEALVAAGEPLTSTLLGEALDYLGSTQEADGGFPYIAGAASNTNSTGFALQGIVAAGTDPLTTTWTISATTPVSYLLGMQTEDGGFAYITRTEGADLFATVQVLPGLVGKPFPYLSNAVATRKAVAWIRDQQQPDGSFEGFNPGATLDAVLALRAAGIDPATVISGDGNSPLDYLGSVGADYGTLGASAAGKLIVGWQAAGGDPRDIEGYDAVAALTEYYTTTGAYGDGTSFSHGWALIGLVAAGETVPAQALTFALESEATGGGWGYFPASESADPDSTALMLQALAAVEVPASDEAVINAFAYLREAQNGDGGFPGFDGLTSASTTGIVLQALAAYNQPADGLSWTTVVTDGTTSRLTLHTPADRILTLQSFEGGFAGFSGANDPYSTYQSLIGILGQPYPLAQAPTMWYLPLISRATP